MKNKGKYRIFNYKKRKSFSGDRDRSRSNAFLLVGSGQSASVLISCPWSYSGSRCSGASRIR